MYEVKLLETALVKFGHHSQGRAVFFQEFDGLGIGLISADEYFLASLIAVDAQDSKNVTVIAVYNCVHFFF